MDKEQFMSVSDEIIDVWQFSAKDWGASIGHDIQECNFYLMAFRGWVLKAIWRAD